MKLTHTAGNILAAKVCVAAKHAGISLELVESAMAPHIPMYDVEGLCLELPSGARLFSSNVSVAYLLGKFDVASEASSDDDTIRWEESQLRPVVFGRLAHPNDQYLSKALPSKLDYIATLLDSHSFCGNPTAGDLALWAMLHTLTLCFPQANVPDAVTKYYESLMTLCGAAANALNVTNESVTQHSMNLGEYIHTQAIEEAKREVAAMTYARGEFGTAEKIGELIAEGEKSSKPQAQQKKAAVEEVGESFRMATEEEIVTAKTKFFRSGGDCEPVRVRDAIVLPKKDANERNILITSALPYVNNVPHLGNIIGCVLSADAYSRYTRVMGYNSVFICGTDEYGTTTETKALAEGMTPQQICDKYHALHAEIYEWFNIGFDKFGRTTTEKHTKIAQDIFLDLYHQDNLVNQTVMQLKCESCMRFLADRYVEGTCPTCGYEDARGDQCDACQTLINAIELINPRCKVCDRRPIETESKHLYLNIPKLSTDLKDWYADTNAKCPWSKSANSIMKSEFHVDNELQPRCVTRDLKWGTPVPLDGEMSSKVFYVWFDAPIGYISITANYTDDWKEWWYTPENNVELYQFMAKDNVTFHGVIFPTSLIGTGKPWTKVKHLNSVEYLNYEDSKFSKSRGIGVFGNDAQGTGIKADIWRFYLLWVRPENSDSVFSWGDFLACNNNILNNNLGNFVHRALMFVKNSFGGKIPESNPNDEDYNFIGIVNTELAKYTKLMEVCRIREAAYVAMDISRLGNQYLQTNKPWVLAKSDVKRCGTVVSLAANLAYLLATLIEPYMPESAKRLCGFLNLPMLSLNYGYYHSAISPGHEIGTPEILFSKIEQSTVDELRSRFAGVQSERDVAPVTDVAPADPAVVACLEGQIKTQGEAVRALKNADPVDKVAIGAEVQELLRLKKELAVLTGEKKTGKK
eukprot:CFRG0014T1